MQKERKYMHVCRQCKTTYSSDSSKGQICRECGGELELMPILRSEWVSLSNEDKEKYKNTYLEQVKPENRKYKYKSATPLAWHKFSFYFRAPVGIILTAVAFVKKEYNIATVINLALILLFFEGSFSWKRYAWISIIANDACAIIASFITFCVSEGNPTYLGQFIAISIICGLEISYYKKREKLFNNSKDDLLDNEEREMIESTISNENSEKAENESIDEQKVVLSNVGNNTSVKFCRYCGEELKENSVFCHNCGKKLLDNGEQDEEIL